MNVSLGNLPITMRDFLLVQIMLALMCLFFIIFDNFYLSPKQQAADLDRYKNELTAQLALIAPINQKKLSDLLSATTANHPIDSITIDWQDQQWVFRNSTADMNNGSMNSQANNGEQNLTSGQSLESKSSIHLIIDISDVNVNAGLIDQSATANSLTANSISTAAVLTIKASVVYGKRYLFGYIMALISITTVIIFTLLIQSKIINESRQVNNQLLQLTETKTHPDDTLTNTNPLAIPIFYWLGDIAAQVNKIAQQLHQSPFANTFPLSEQQTALEDRLGQSETEKAELSLAKKSAMEANQVKSQIIANTGHELLTPLNSIVGFSKILLDKKVNPKEQDNFLQRINDNALHLSALVNDLLDFSIRNDRGFKLNYQTTDIYALFHSIANTMAYEAESKGLHFIADFDSLEDCIIDIDPLRLRQVISNLAINAIRYTDAGHVKISACFIDSDRGDKQLYLQVEDTGIGITQEQQKHIFSAFVSQPSGDRPNASNPGLGLGLGLSIVASILQRIAAELSVESEQGKGSKFIVKVPIKQFKRSIVGANIAKLNRIQLCGDYQPALTVMAQRLQPYARELNLASCDSFDTKMDCDLIILCLDKAEVGQLNNTQSALYNTLLNATNNIVIHSPIGVSIRSSALLSKPKLNIVNGPFAITQLFTVTTPYPDKVLDKPDYALPSSAQKALKTLVVDDNLANIELLTLFLTSINCDVDSVLNGKDALDLLATGHYDWIFLDIRMQPMDGIELIKNIRLIDRYESTPIIACTAHTSKEEFRKLIDSGFDKVTYKPVQSQQLAELANNFFASELPDINKPDPENANESYSAAEYNNTNPKHHFDLDQAINKTSGNRATAARIFLMLIDELEKSLALRDSLATANRETVIEHIHQLNGAVAMTGAPALKKQLDQCESFLKEPSNGNEPTLALEAQLDTVYDHIEILVSWYHQNDMDIIFA